MAFLSTSNYVQETTIFWLKDVGSIIQTYIAYLQFVFLNVRINMR